MDEDNFFFFLQLGRAVKIRGEVEGTYLQSQPDALHHPALDAGFTQDVVGSDARLPAVDKLAPGDATVSRENKRRLALLFRAHNV